MVICCSVTAASSKGCLHYEAWPSAWQPLFVLWHFIHLVQVGFDRLRVRAGVWIHQIDVVGRGTVDDPLIRDPSSERTPAPWRATTSHVPTTSMQPATDLALTSPKPKPTLTRGECVLWRPPLCERSTSPSRLGRQGPRDSPANTRSTTKRAAPSRAVMHSPTDAVDVPILADQRDMIWRSVCSLRSDISKQIHLLPEISWPVYRSLNLVARPFPRHKILLHHPLDGKGVWQMLRARVRDESNIPYTPCGIIYMEFRHPRFRSAFGSLLCMKTTDNMQIKEA